MALTAYSTVTILVAFLSLLLLRLVYLTAYRLFLHPLAKVPGETLAAITSLYEIYYDSLLQGKFVYRVDEAHRKYGTLYLHDMSQTTNHLRSGGAHQSE